ncbi:GNAT family N-acetyltransferase [Kitasatospora viridis]|uniref:Ribosomal-protein-serine acetyltransferase n=1 Tax=Kitasatospora viridis TaxID=281105 RepID=A0A561UFB1_9ACTN|nr:GNAT family protein [Kitasatospora viridis]TWF98042.1 ribosomal-protein-serine acetyltransferase [Kitasatospora viridis]
MSNGFFFTRPLHGDAVLVPSTPAIAEPYYAALAANQPRFARWEPWAAQPPEPEGTRTFLEQTAAAWQNGTALPVAIAVPGPDGAWAVVGSIGLRIDRTSGTAELGYWVDAAHEGRGLVRRGAEAVLAQAFGPLGLSRVRLGAAADNERSRALAERLGFTFDEVVPGGLEFADGPRDRALYHLTAEEWAARRG